MVAEDDHTPDSSPLRGGKPKNCEKVRGVKPQRVGWVHLEGDEDVIVVSDEELSSSSSYEERRRSSSRTRSPPRRSSRKKQNPLLDDTRAGSVPTKVSLSFPRIYPVSVLASFGVVIAMLFVVYFFGHAAPHLLRCTTLKRAGQLSGGGGNKSGLFPQEGPHGGRVDGTTPSHSDGGHHVGRPTPPGAGGGPVGESKQESSATAAALPPPPTDDTCTDPAEQMLQSPAAPPSTPGDVWTPAPLDPSVKITRIERLQLHQYEDRETSKEKFAATSPKNSAVERYVVHGSHREKSSLLVLHNVCLARIVEPLKYRTFQAGGNETRIIITPYDSVLRGHSSQTRDAVGLPPARFEKVQRLLRGAVLASTTLGGAAALGATLRGKKCTPKINFLF